MRSFLLSWVLVAFMAGASEARAQNVAVVDLRAEHLVDPVGIDAAAPRLGWRMASARRGAAQTAYRVQTAADPAALRAGKKLLWDSGKVASDQSVDVVYGGPAPVSSRRYYWRVKLWDEAGRETGWSEPAFWEMGLLSPGDWKAEWITYGWDEPTDASQPQPMLRGALRLEKPVAEARLYVTSLGLYAAEINGRRVGDQVLTPGWTSYHKRLQYQTYDVTALVRPGDNALGVMLGDGWYRGNIGFSGQRNVWGDRLALRAMLRVVYRDGSAAAFGTGGDWTAKRGPVRLADIYDGEIYDARLEEPGWSSPGFAAAGWTPVRRMEAPEAKLVGLHGPPIRRMQEIRPVKVLRTPAGETVLDMGQNMVGWMRLRVSGPAGTTIRLRHAEVLDRKGNFYTENLRRADAQMTYTLKGGGEEVYEPYFTFFGFRYVAVEGFPGPVTPEAFTGVVVYSDMAPAGSWTSSHPLLNKLYENIVWGQRGNFLDVPTDCPQRDERLGWTGDAQVFARTATYNMDTQAFYTKWLADLDAEQRADGSVPAVIPEAYDRGRPSVASSAAWADAAAIVPWTVYLAYGDRRLLETHYPNMKRWVGYIRSRADEGLWNTGFHFGDWLAYATTRSDYPGATTGKDLIATAYYAYSSSLVAKAAAVLGRADEAAEYAAVSEEARRAFNREFVTAGGRVGENTQTAYALALRFDLLPEALRPEAARRLVEDIQEFGYHLTTGFVGTPYLCHVLSDHGKLPVAYALLNQETYPSWLYPVKMGATTIWERWDGQKPDSTFQDPSMNSFNHYAYGAVGEWMFSTVAGIDLDPARPGYKHVVFRPEPGGGLTQVRAAHTSPYGEIVSAWRLDGEDLVYAFTAPPNSTATVRLPGVAESSVREGDAPLAQSAGVRNVRSDGGDLVFDIGSGAYTFRHPAGDRAYLLTGGRVNVTTALAEILGNAAGRSALEAHAPTLARIAEGDARRTLSLLELRKTMPELTPETLARINAALKAIR